MGERLFQTCLDYIRASNFSAMTWETARDNKADQSLYDKMGGQISQWFVYEIQSVINLLKLKMEKAVPYKWGQPFPFLPTAFGSNPYFDIG